VANLNPEVNLAAFIDHSFLNPAATPEQIIQCCEEADRFGFPTVCIFPSAVRQAVEFLHNKRPKVCTVIGFPTGATTSATKRFEAQEATENGATELDIVINLGWLKSGNTDALHREIATIVEETGLTTKAILETALLTDAEKVLAAEICMDAGVAFLKTSTGWAEGATVKDVQLLKQVAKDRVAIKASGGIRTLEQAIALIQAGATRLGTSYGPALVQQRGTLEEGSNY
jgi:deoxyribose-phosphate aldolase